MVKVLRPNDSHFQAYFEIDSPLEKLIKTLDSNFNGLANTQEGDTIYYFDLQPNNIQDFQRFVREFLSHEGDEKLTQKTIITYSVDEKIFHKDPFYSLLDTDGKKYIFNGDFIVQKLEIREEILRVNLTLIIKPKFQEDVDRVVRWFEIITLDNWPNEQDLLYLKGLKKIELQDLL